MMGRGRLFRGSLASLSALTLLAIATPAISAPSTSSGNDISATGQESFSELSSCASDADNFLAAIVVDESGSLEGTDPKNARIGAITTVVNSLSSLSNSSGGQLNVEASLAVFGKMHTLLVPWQKIGVDGADEGLRNAASKLSDRDENNGLFTNYQAALSGAQTNLNDQAAELGGTTCKVILLFTDGKLDLDNSKKTTKETDKARAAICEPNGTIDSVRADQISVLALALFKDTGDGQVSAKDRDLLRAVAEGRANDTSCGTVPIRTTSRGGAYLSASDASALNLLFAQVGARIGGGTEGASITCPGAECLGGILEIPVDAGIEGFRVLIDRAVTDSPPSLRAPDGGDVDLSIGTNEVGDAEVTLSDRDRLSTIDVTFTGNRSPGGTWHLDLGSLVATKVSYFYFWGAQVTIVAPEDGLVINNDNVLHFMLTDSAGATLDPLTYGSVSVIGTVGESAFTATMNEAGIFETNISVPADDVPQSMNVAVSAHAVTTPSGIRLGPISSNASIDTKLPAEYPSIATSELVFPTIVGTEPETATLHINGSAQGPTRACFTAGAVSGPDSAKGITLTPNVDCVEIPAGEARDVEIRLSPVSKADGRAEGTLNVTLDPVDSLDASIAQADPITKFVPVSASLTRPVDGGKQALYTAALVLLALLIAWATAEIARRRSDRYRINNGTQFAAVDIVIDGSHPRRADGKSGPLLDPATDFQRLASLGKGGRTSSFSADGIKYVRKFPRWPLSAGRGEVAAPQRIVVAGPHGDISTPDGSRAPVLFPGTTDFIVTARPEGIQPDRISARLVMVVDAPTGVADVLPDRLDEVARAQWPNIVELVRSAGTELSSPVEEVLTQDGTPSFDVPTNPASTSDGPPPLTTMFDDVPPTIGQASSGDSRGKRSGGRRSKPSKKSPSAGSKGDSSPLPPTPDPGGRPAPPNLFD